MWHYQRPGFEALLLAELQKQQQCGQFCDTLLRAEGISVPAHSCILSAISPQISSALSSAPAPRAGHSHVLELQALGPCNLLHMVRLLYSGEMSGEGEREKQEAISAAANMGIHGLVEVTERDRKSRSGEGVIQSTEAGVQTEPLWTEKNERTQHRWRREVRDGCTFLWKETLSDGGKDMWTQTEELQINTAPSIYPDSSFETIDVSALQGLEQIDSHLVPPQIVPVSLVYPPNETQTLQPFSALSASVQESTAAGSTSVTVVAPPYTSVPPSLAHLSSQPTPCAVNPQSCWVGPQRDNKGVAADEECEQERFEQFKDNIPGFILHFVNRDKEEGSRRGRAGGRRGAGVGGARRAGTGEMKARKPRARPGGRGQGVGVGRLQKLFLHRWGMRALRTGQGGGAVGRKLCLKTRELLKPASSGPRRVRSKVWEISQSGAVLLRSGGGRRSTQRGQKNTPQHVNQDSLPVTLGQSSRAKSTTSVSFPFPPIHSCNTLCASSPSLQPSPSPSLPSPAASYASPASSLLHTTSLPPPAPPPHEEQPEHIDRLLEEVMKGLDILPKDASAPHSQHPLPTSTSSCTLASSGNTSAQNKQQCLATGLHRSTVAVAVVRGADCSRSANGEVPLLQQQCEGELNEMLEQFLQSFEQHVESCSATEENDTGGESSTEASQPYTVLRKHKKNKNQTATSDAPRLQNIHERQSDETKQSRSQTSKASARRPVSPEHTEGTPGDVRAAARTQYRKRPRQYLFSLEKKRRRKAVSSAKTKIIHDLQDKQLRQVPVVKLERSLLPAIVTLQGHRLQSLQDKGVARTNTDSSSVKYCCDGLSGENKPLLWSLPKYYPIRSRLRDTHMMEPRQHKQSPAADQSGCGGGRPRKNEELLSLSNSESTTPPSQPQPVDPSGTDEQQEKNRARHEEEATVRLQEEAEGPTRTRKKRSAKSNDNTSGDATVTKRVCVEQVTLPTCAPCTPSAESADLVSKPATRKPEEVIDVETVSLTSLQEEEERKETPVGSEINLGETEESLMDEETENSANEIIDVEGDDEDAEPEKDDCQKRTAPTPIKPSASPPHPAEKSSLESAGSWAVDRDEDVDVIGGSSPGLDPMIISWTESSEGEEEQGDKDVDVVGEQTDYSSSAIFTAVSKGEFVGRNCRTEVVLH